MVTMAISTLQACASDMKSMTEFKPGTEFKDCESCPVMVVMPKGEFMMGVRQNDKPDYLHKIAVPLHKVTIDYQFAVGKYEVTVGEYKQCMADKVCSKPGRTLSGRFCIASGKYKGVCFKAGGFDAPFWGDNPNMPVAEANWYQAQQYVEWLSNKTGKAYRLLSEAEWEYAARGGTDTRYWWGDEEKKGMTNCKDCVSFEFRTKFQSIEYIPVGKFPPNPFGLHDMTGNVDEWVEDCFKRGFEGAPNDGSPRMEKECPKRVIKGGRAYQPIKDIVLSSRSSAYVPELRPGLQDVGAGFRVALTLKNKSRFQNKNGDAK